MPPENKILGIWNSSLLEVFGFRISYILSLFGKCVLINALKYSFIEILNVLFNSKFCREENILTPASSLGSVKNYLANITQIYCEEENCFHHQPVTTPASKPGIKVYSISVVAWNQILIVNLARGKMSGKFGKSIKLINSFQKLNKQNRSSEFVWRINFQEQKL